MNYLIRLADGCYAVGTENDRQSLIDWLTIHPYIGETIELSEIKTTEQWTLHYMARYGRQRVRGGTMSQPILTIEQDAHLTRVLFINSPGHCQRCGRDEHRTDFCVTQFDIHGWQLSSKPLTTCGICGRTNHSIEQCFRKQVRTACHRCGSPRHLERHCQKVK